MAFAALGSFSCGFAPLGDARELLNVRFAVTGLLFLVFDLEVHFALAWTFDATTGSQAADKQRVNLEIAKPCYDRM